MKTIEVNVSRRTYGTYEVEVADDFDVNAVGALNELYLAYYEGLGGEGLKPIYEQIDDFCIEYATEV